jgi:hypothetical protein
MPCWQKQSGAERIGAMVTRHVPTDAAPGARIRFQGSRGCDSSGRQVDIRN